MIGDSTPDKDAATTDAATGGFGLWPCEVCGRRTDHYDPEECCHPCGDADSCALCGKVWDRSRWASSSSSPGEDRNG